MTPLESDQCEFLSSNIRGTVEGQPAEMIVNSGCTRSLVHKRFTANSAFTGDKITVLTAARERMIVPLAWVEFVTGQERHIKLVGVMEKLPFDCLLGCSSFGQTLSCQNVLDQWEKIVFSDNPRNSEAFKVCSSSPLDA